LIELIESHKKESTIRYIVTIPDLDPSNP